MKNKLKIALIISAICFCNSALAQIADELTQKSRLASANDMVGTWEMTWQTVRPSIKTDSLFFADYQILKFSEDGYVKNITSTKPFDMGQIKMYLELMPKKTTYSFISDGLLVINRSKYDSDNIMILLITEDITQSYSDKAPLLKKGNLVLHYFDPNKQLYMLRYFKKINLD